MMKGFFIVTYLNNIFNFIFKHNAHIGLGLIDVNDIRHTKEIDIFI